MKCPCCGNELVLDGHRKSDMFMCYDCGYVSDRKLEHKPHSTNFERLRSMDLNESIAFLANNLGLDKRSITLWMENSVA